MSLVSTFNIKMCIRDRPIVFGEDRLRERGSLPATVFFYQGKFFFGAILYHVTSVSYTHLDVYKRQDVDHSIP